jgi:hypothetical protein
LALALPDDLVPGSKWNQMGEAGAIDTISIGDKLRNRLGEGTKFIWHNCSFLWGSGAFSQRSALPKRTRTLSLLLFARFSSRGGGRFAAATSGFTTPRRWGSTWLTASPIRFTSRFAAATTRASRGRFAAGYTRGAARLGLRFLFGLGLILTALEDAKAGIGGRRGQRVGHHNENTKQQTTKTTGQQAKFGLAGRIGNDKEGQEKDSQPDQKTSEPAPGIHRLLILYEYFMIRLSIVEGA